MYTATKLHTNTNRDYGFAQNKYLIQNHLPTKQKKDDVVRVFRKQAMCPCQGTLQN